MRMLEKRNKRDRKMAKIGDRVTITIHGPNVLNGTASTAMATTPLGIGQLIAVKGKITEDLGDNWRIQLDSPFLGGQHIVIPKTRVE